MPYSEALFFFGSSLFLRGYWPSARDAPARADHPGPDGRRPMAREMRSPKLAVAGLFLASLTRSASNVFLPAVIVTEWLSDRGSARRACVFGLTTAAGVCLVAVIQHAQAGPWLGFVSAHQPWGAMRSGHGCR